MLKGATLLEVMTSLDLVLLVETIVPKLRRCVAWGLFLLANRKNTNYLETNGKLRKEC